MPLSATNYSQFKGHLTHQDIYDFYNLFTGVMTDQPVHFANTLQVDGQIFAQDGIYTAPAYAFTSMKNRGFYKLDGASIRVSADFYVGGSATPWLVLSPDGSDGGCQLLMYQNRDLNNSPYLVLKVNNNNACGIYTDRNQSAGIQPVIPLALGPNTEDWMIFNYQRSVIDFEQAICGNIYGEIFVRDNTDGTGPPQRMDIYYNYKLNPSAPSDGEVLSVGATQLFDAFGVLTSAGGNGVLRDLYLGSSGPASVHLMTQNYDRWRVSPQGHLLAGADFPYDIGGPSSGQARNVFANGALATGYKAGPPIDSDVSNPTDGMLRLDTTGNVMYFRSSGQWRSTGTGGGSGGGTASILVYEAQAVSAASVTLPQMPLPNGIVGVYVNGQALIQGRDWGISGQTISFTTPLTADDVHVEYQISGLNPNGFTSHYETTLAVGQSTIPLPQTPSGMPLLTRGGVTQYSSAGQYSLAGSTITLAQPIQPGEDGRISVDFVAGASTSPVVDNNLLTNGGFDVWQRGLGTTTTASGYSGCDRWLVALGGSDTISLTREATVVAPGSNASLKAIVTVPGGNMGSRVTQVLEGSMVLRGRMLSLSMQVWCNSPNSVRISISDNSGTGVAYYSSYHPGDSQWHTMTVSGVVNPINDTGVNVHLWFSGSCTFYLDNAMLVAGPIAVDFKPVHPADDLARCLRYYQLWTPDVAWPVALGVCSNTTTATFYKYLKAPVSVTPSITFSAPAFWAMMNAAGGQVVLTTIAVWTTKAGDDFFTMNCNVASGMVGGNATQLQAAASGAWMQVEANP